MSKRAAYRLISTLFLAVSSMVLTIPAHAECLVETQLGSIIFGALGSFLDCQSNTISPNALNAMYQQLQEAADQINSLPDQINNAGPGGQKLTDATAGVKQIAGYVKWLFSPNSAQELLGKTFAPIGINLMVIFTMTVAMVSIYISINIIVFTIKMIVWAMNQILKLLPFW